MSPKTLAKLKAACLFVDAEHRKGTAPDVVIQNLVAHHGAKLLCGAQNILLCCEVVTTSTYSRSAALLAGWRRLAGATVQVESRK